jgi:two-component system chemotaxis sensor kinase CheA
MNEFLEQFLLESRELVEQATRELLALEREPADREKLDSAFRAFHTLKGGAGIVDFTAMSRAVHAVEDALAAVRRGARPISAALIGDCLACGDQVAQWLDEMQDTGELPVSPDSAADAIVARLGYGADPVRNDEAVPPHETVFSSENAILSPAAQRLLEEQLRILQIEDAAGRQGRVASAAGVAINVLRSTGRQTEAASVEDALVAILKGSDVGLLSDAIARALRADDAENAAPTARAGMGDGPARVLRVEAGRVDALVNLTGEMIIAKNAVAHIAKLAEDSASPLAAALKNEALRLEGLTKTLQSAVLGLRVLPLRQTFQRFSRVVRELAVELEKPANLAIEGEGTEVDKTIAEMLFEPLLHVVRNAMDHGIESASERAAAEKSAVATIRLRARRDGDRVVIEVIDDGRGIDLERVRILAVRRGVVEPDAISAMSDQEVVDLVFKPGFSTAGAVTDLSGRGVGMDAVRTSVARVGGAVTIESEHGLGCTVRFVLPFSVMMTPVMTVEAGGQMFGIPLDAIAETVRVPRGRISPIGTASAFVLRDRTIPLVDLAGMLGRPSRQDTAAEVTAVIALVSGQLGALGVDRLGQRMDVMLKPIEGLLAGIPGIAGTTVMGDGQVLLILDLQQLFG